MGFKIYTKTGDQGSTSLFGGKRLPKNHIRIESYGAVDELNSHLGLLRDQNMHSPIKDLLETIQNKLFIIGSNLASDPDKEMNLSKIKLSDIELLETQIDAFEKELPELKNFILPGGHIHISSCHIARCVCRRAERRAVALSIDSEVDSLIIKYLNRLSDFLFVLARKIALDLEVDEILWTGK